MALSLRGKTALVTGAGRGIGAAIVTRFAEAGARVIAANRTIDHVVELTRNLQALGLAVEPKPLADLSKDGLARLVDEAAGAGSLDILVHNAGGCEWADLEDLTEEILSATLSINLEACFWLVQAALPYMRMKRGGRILITSSVTGPRVAMAGAAHYAAAKAGVNGFVRSAALELARDNITVNAVEPGFIAKPGRGRLGTPEAMARLAAHVPLGCMGEADDVAFAMLYLASDEARYVTGQLLVVDGGAVLPETGYALENLKTRA
jgi:3-oxoacyl-[acyl-carrier protein] reductase